MIKKILALAILLIPLSAAAQEGLKLDNTQPIEITSDALEVLQQNQQAVFKGNVLAVQGKMKLSASEMKVYYRKPEEKGNAQGVSKIEVVGNVFLATPEESAKSQTGIYDVDSNKIYLKGNVVLTRGENVVKGDNLEYDLTTGRSQIVGSSVTTGANGEGGKKGRVRGLFLPKSK